MCLFLEIKDNSYRLNYWLEILWEYRKGAKVKWKNIKQGKVIISSNLFIKSLLFPPLDIFLETSSPWWRHSFLFPSTFFCLSHSHLHRPPSLPLNISFFFFDPLRLLRLSAALLGITGKSNACYYEINIRWSSPSCSYLFFSDWSKFEGDPISVSGVWFV